MAPALHGGSPPTPRVPVLLPILPLQPQPPQLRRDYVLPAELSSTDSLAEGAPYEQAGRRERAEFEARLGCVRWDLHEVRAGRSRRLLCSPAARS